MFVRSKLWFAALSTLALFAGAARAQGVTPTPNALTFTNTGVGAMSASQNVQFTNNTAGSITLQTIVLAGANPTDYTLQNMPGLPVLLPPGVGVGVDVLCSPNMAGALPAKVSAQVGGVANTNDVTLTCTGVGPKITITPSPINAGGLPFNDSIPPQSLTCSNAGGSQLNVTAISLSGADAAFFSLTSLPTFPVPLGPSQNFPFSLNFAPTSPRQYNASLVVTSTDPMTPTLTVTITGLSGDPQVGLDVGTIIFGGQNVNTSSLPQDVNILNTGLSDLHVSHITSVGQNAMDFAVTKMPVLPVTVPVGGMAKFTVVFTPSAGGMRMASVQVTSDDPITPNKNLNMTGSGTSSMLSAMPAMIDFGTVLVGKKGMSTLMVTNAGNGPATVKSMVITGADAALFKTSLAAPFVVGKGATTNVSVTYAPTMVSTSKVTLTLTTDDPLLPSYQVAMQGMGSSPTFMVAPMSLDFAGTDVDANSPAQTFVVSNTGNATLNITTLLLSGPSSFSFTLTPNAAPIAIMAGKSQIFSVFYSPQSAEMDQASVVMATDDPLNPMGMVSLTGLGLEAMIEVMPDDMMLDFGTVLVGQTGMLPVKIQNTGGADLIISNVMLSSVDPDGGPEFTLDAASTTTPFTVPMGMTKTITVSYKPTMAITSTATLEIDPFDTNLSSSTLALTGTGSTPMLTAVPSTITFPPTAVGTTSTPVMLSILNSATKSQVLNIPTSDNPVFGIDSSAFTKIVPSMASAAVQVTFSPTATGPASGHVQFFLQGQTTPIATTIVSGTGLPGTDTGGDGGMAPPPRGGCSVSGTGSASANGQEKGLLLGLIGMVGLALVVRRRRRSA